MESNNVLSEISRVHENPTDVLKREIEKKEEEIDALKREIERMELGNQYDEMAKETKAIMDCFIRAGFTEEQSFSMTMELFVAAIGGTL